MAKVSDEEQYDDQYKMQVEEDYSIIKDIC